MKITEPTICAIRGRSSGEWKNSKHNQKLEIGGGVCNSITSVSKDSLVIEPSILKMKRTEEEKRRRHLEGDKGAKFSASKFYAPSADGLSNTVTTNLKDNMLMEQKKKRYRIRKLTARECFRLMDVDDSDIDKIKASGISESQQYKLAGNSIVVNVMFCMFKNLFCEEEQYCDTLF